MNHLASAAKIPLQYITGVANHGRPILARHLTSLRPRLQVLARNPYDTNSFLSLHEAILESDRVKLTPFIPSLHAKDYAE